MRATYCPQCDETRWQLTGLPVQRATTCSACGAELQIERRLPGRGRAAVPASERRTGERLAPSRATPV